jgi:hypothetical protein
VASTDAKSESKKGKVATVAGPVVSKSEVSRSSGSLFEIDKDSDPEVYSVQLLITSNFRLLPYQVACGWVHDPKQLVCSYYKTVYSIFTYTADFAIFYFSCLELSISVLVLSAKYQHLHLWDISTINRYPADSPDRNLASNIIDACPTTLTQQCLQATLRFLPACVRPGPRGQWQRGREVQALQGHSK